jgi:hypothetical protein
MLDAGRRQFITLLGGAAAWPLPARAQQQPERMRRIGVLLPGAPDDAEAQSWVGAFLQGLAQSGWITGRNIRIETRWTKFDPEETRKYAAELVALAPDSHPGDWQLNGGTLVAIDPHGADRVSARHRSGRFRSG